MNVLRLAALAFVLALIPFGAFADDKKADFSLLNVSYDPTREVYQQYNVLFADYYQKNFGKTVAVSQSHGGSGKQARSVIDGLEADVVTLALAYDIDAIADSKLLPQNWASRLPQNSTPYTSTIVFLVRKGNPKNIKTWDDLVKPGVGVITSNPKTSGGARWAFLAAYGYELRKTKSDAKATEFIKALYNNVPVLDSGARGATLSFTQKGLGDVLLAWENESALVFKEFGRENYDLVVPSTSILAEPPVAVVDSNVDKHHTRAVAEEYLKYLYSPAAQDLFAQNGYRPRDAATAKKYAGKFPKIDLFTLADTFGDWRTTQKKFFADGGIFDSIYTPQ